MSLRKQQPKSRAWSGLRKGESLVLTRPALGAFAMMAIAQRCRLPAWSERSFTRQPSDSYPDLSVVRPAKAGTQSSPLEQSKQISALYPVSVVTGSSAFADDDTLPWRLCDHHTPANQL